MQTLARPLPAGTATASREEVMAFYAHGTPAAFLRALAADPVAVADVAAGSGATGDEARGLMLSLADVAAALEAPAPAEAPRRITAAAEQDGKFTADITRFAQARGTARHA